MNIFIKTFFIVAAIFIVGIFIGTFIDLNNTNKIREDLEISKIELSDILTQSSYFTIFDKGTEFCNASISGNIEFADAIYKKGLEIEKLEYTNRFSTFLYYEKKKYIVSKLQFWLNSIALREKCNANYTTLVYFYSHDISLAIDADQKAQQAVLENVKDTCGNRLLLIPIQTDLNLTVVTMVLNQYKIDYTPSILIDEKIVLKGLQNFNTINNYVNC